MERRLEKLAAFSFAAALVLEGCSPVASPTKTLPTNPEAPTRDPKVPIENIIDCQMGPFKGKISYDLKKGESKDIGGITASGEEEDIVIVSEGNAKIHPLTTSAFTLDSDTELIFHSKNFKYYITQGFGADSGSKGEVILECIRQNPTT